MGGKWKKWTQAEDIRLIELFPNIEVIQNELSVNRKRILTRAVDLGLVSYKKNIDGLLTKLCKFCGAEFSVIFAHRGVEFCSRSCQSRAIKKNDSRRTSQCIVCQTMFKHYGERMLCSVACNAKYMAQNRLGEANPAFNPDKFITVACRNCQEEFVYTKLGHDKVPQYCTKSCWDEFQCGKNRMLDGPAVYATPYPSSFKSIKKLIREREGFACILCGSVGTNELAVHHIDYDKNNCDASNLVALCERCHGLTNFQRSFWEVLFRSTISGSKIIKKGWGVECHIVNHDRYCLKYLIFFKGKKFSYHFHKLKKELWHCLLGKFSAKIDDAVLLFKAGEKIEVQQFQLHQLEALENSVIVEVSMMDFPEDSYRIEKGD